MRCLPAFRASVLRWNGRRINAAVVKDWLKISSHAGLRFKVGRFNDQGKGNINKKQFAFYAKVRDRHADKA